MGLQEIGLVVFAFEVICELGDVVYLNVVFRFCDQGASWTAPAVVVGGTVIDFKFLFLGGGKLEEVLCERELTIHLLLGQAIVLYVELRNMSICFSGIFRVIDGDLQIQHDEPRVRAV
jgi:hypothetical protein